MKTLQLIISSFLLATAFSSAALAGDSRSSDLMVRLTDRPYVERGMTRETVREVFGMPSAQLSRDVWVYFDFQAVNPVARGTQNSAAAQKQDTLVVAFKDDRVSLIRACDSKPVRALIAQQEKSQ